jgi:hypothetical protein
MIRRVFSTTFFRSTEQDAHITGIDAPSVMLLPFSLYPPDDINKILFRKPFGPHLPNQFAG